MFCQRNSDYSECSCYGCHLCLSHLNIISSRSDLSVLTFINMFFLINENFKLF